MQNLSHLKALQALDATIRLGALTNAAADLGVTPAALGQRIRTLEVYLGHQLLERTPHGTVPTPAAKEAADDLAEGFKRLVAAAKKLQFERLNEVYVTADSDWAELWLAPRLSGFQASHPKIKIILEDNKTPTDTKPDFEIRFTRIDEVNGEILYPEYLVPVCSQSINDSISKLPRETRLEGVSLLHLISQVNPPHMFGWPEWVEQFGYRKPVTGRGIQYVRIAHALRVTAHMNAGLLICGVSLALDQLDSGDLIMPFPFAEGAWSGYAYELLYQEDILQRPQAVKFYEWLTQTAQETGARITAACCEP